MNTVIINTDTNEAITRILPKPLRKLHPQAILQDNQKEIPVIHTPKPTDYDPNFERPKRIGYVVEDDHYVLKWDIETISQYEIAKRNWPYVNYSMRLKAPKSLGETYPEMYVNFMLRKLPIVDVPDNNDMVYIYCNEIMDDHIEIMEALQNIVTQENRPEILNPEE